MCAGGCDGAEPTAIHAEKASMHPCPETITNRWVCRGGHHDLFMIDRLSKCVDRARRLSRPQSEQLSC
jgi:hypothetical protein